MFAIGLVLYGHISQAIAQSKPKVSSIQKTSDKRMQLLFSKRDAALSKLIFILGEAL